MASRRDNMARAYLLPPPQPQNAGERQEDGGPYRRPLRTLDYGRVAISQVRACQGPALRTGGIVVALLASVVLFVVGLAVVWCTLAIWRVSAPVGVACVTFWLGLGIWLANGKLWRL